MDNVKFRPTELMQNIAIDVMKKSMDVQKRDVLSTLNNSVNLGSQKIVASTLQKGVNLDLKV